MDYDRTHQSYLESKYKAQKQNGTFLSFHPLSTKISGLFFSLHLRNCLDGGQRRKSFYLKICWGQFEPN